MRRVFTSESVTEGHPDKVADYIADTILDAYLEEDSYSRTAIEVALYSNSVKLFGEITSNAQPDIDKLVRQTITNIGYTEPQLGFSAENVSIECAFHKQSSDIAMGLSGTDINGGAGDQGIMFGYADKDGLDYLPLSIAYAHRLTKRLAECRKRNILSYLYPDGKSQVSIEYDEEGKPLRIDTVVISTSHKADVDIETVRRDVREKVIEAVLPMKLFDYNTRVLINPTGRFVHCGPAADSGLTGHKLICDTYGGVARHGGGAFSGKDASKTDRTGAYAARFLAKNVVAAGLADRCEIELAYAIGVAEPVGIFVETFGTEHTKIENIYQKVKAVDLRPNALIDRFNLRRPVFEDLSNYGHFGENAASAPWEKVDHSLL